MKRYSFCSVFVIACSFLPMFMYAVEGIFDEVAAVFKDSGDLQAVAKKLESLSDPNVTDETRGTLLNYIISLGNAKEKVVLGALLEGDSEANRTKHAQIAKIEKRIVVRTTLIEALLKNDKLDVNKADDYSWFPSVPHLTIHRVPLFQLLSTRGNET